MRRTTRLLAVTLVAALVSVGAAGLPSLAEELPPGFTDGVPQGEDAGGSDMRMAESQSATTMAASTERHFGEGAYNAVRSAVAATSRPCAITNDGLTALVLAPVFAESSAATTASTAPAPMTLSRYDEWSGTFGTSTTRNANHGLYAFRNPSTSYKRAFWHPGLGIWQYDTAGLGAPLTTIESMDVRVVSGDVARVVASRYCAASGTDAQKRQAAWGPWVGCNTGNCETFFQEMYSTTPKFANLKLVSGIGPLGGVVQRTCVVQNQTMPCWYVEPRVGVIQGSTAWATLTPLDGGNPTVAPTPISLPFYVIDRGATEERHWMRIDTGYGIDISAVRNIGKDARPRSTQTGSGLAWSSTSSLCDITTSRGACTPVPPPGVTSKATPVSGSGYRPIALDATGDGLGDVLWYQPGAGSDSLWRGLGAGSFASHSVSVSSVYDDVLAGDIDGDGDDDVLWYARSSGTAYLWRSNGNGTFTSIKLSPGAGRRPFMLDANGDGDQEIFWYGPGSIPDSQWAWNGTRFAVFPRSVTGTFQPLVGDFDANGRDDIFWYAPGGAADSVWLHSVSGAIVTKSASVNGTYSPLVGDLDGDGADDIFWYAPGPAADSAWFGAPGAAFVGQSNPVSGTYQPFVAALDSTGRDSIIWYAPGTGSDSQWLWSGARARSGRTLYLPGRHIPVVGGYSVGGADGVVWYERNFRTDVTWYR